MTELTMFSRESEEVLQEMNVVYSNVCKAYVDRVAMFKVVYSVEHCTFLLLQWLLDRGVMISKQVDETLDVLYVFGEYLDFNIDVQAKGLITAVDSAVKAIKEQE